MRQQISRSVHSSVMGAEQYFVLSSSDESSAHWSETQLSNETELYVSGSRDLRDTRESKSQIHHS